MTAARPVEIDFSRRLSDGKPDIARVIVGQHSLTLEPEEAVELGWRLLALYAEQFSPSFSPSFSPTGEPL